MIGSNIQSRRRAIGLTQEQLAAALAVARHCYPYRYSL